MRPVLAGLLGVTLGMAIGIVFTLLMQGRQIVVPGSDGAVWRIDRMTGETVSCRYFRHGQFPNETTGPSCLHSALTPP